MLEYGRRYRYALKIRGHFSFVLYKIEVVGDRLFQNKDFRLYSRKSSLETASLSVFEYKSVI